MIFRILFTALLISTTGIKIYSQNLSKYTENGLPLLINSGERINKGIELNSNGDFEEALQEYEYVHPSDTNFVFMQSEKINALYNLERYNEVIEICLKYINQNTPERAAFYRLLAQSYAKLDNKTDALATYQKALKMYPYSPDLLYNLGTFYLGNENYEEAERQFKKTININPYYSNAHLMLGNLSVLKGKKARAMMCYTFYLCLNTTNNKALVLYNNMLNDGIEFEGELDEDEKLFSELELLVQSKVAQNDKFKSNIDFEAPVAQQTELMLQQVKYKPNTQDFWMEFYVPFFEKINQAGYRDITVYLILTSTNDKTVAKRIKQGNDELSQMVSVAESFINEYRANKEIDGADRKKSFWYYDNNKLAAIATQVDDKIVGSSIYYYTNGEKSAEGEYKDGFKEGKWSYYYNNGQLKKTEIYTKGEINGQLPFYDEDGQKMSEANYKGGDLNGEVRTFYPCGQVKEQWSYSNNNKHGSGVSFSGTGIKNVTYSYDSSKFHGPYIIYHLNGQVSERYNYNEGLLNGDYESYYYTGTLKTKGSYKNDSTDGEWTGYHSNGAVKFIGEYENSEKTGTWRYYNYKNILTQKERFIDSVGISATISYYDYLGNLEKETYYDDNKVVGITNYNRQGEIIDKYFDKKGDFKFKEYYLDGQLKAEGSYKNGSLNNTYTAYHNNGNKELECSYANGLLEGVYKLYYERGSIKSEVNYTEGLENGLYKYYHKNGQIKLVGWVIEGQQQQLWLSYHPDGKISDADYLYNNKLNGESVDYDPIGKIYNKYMYDNDRLIEFWQYDTLGNVYNHDQLSHGTGDYIIKYINGKTRYKTTLQCGMLKADQVNYWPDGEVLRTTTVKYETQNGPVRTYYPNGETKLVGDYINGMSEGKWEWKYENGEIDSHAWFLNDENDSLNIQYYDNGQIRSTCEYNQGIRVGKCHYYSPQGELQIVKTYDPTHLIEYSYYDKSGKLISNQVNDDYKVNSYYKNGQLSVDHTYKNQLYHGKQQYFYSNGKLLREFFYDNGLSINESKTYYEDGSLKSVHPYKDDILNGKVLTYYKNGKLKSSTTYINDLKQGEALEYDIDGTLTSKVYYRNDNPY